MFEILLVLSQIFFEFILQVFGEILLGLGLNALAEPFKRREERSPILSFIGYSLLGFAAGGLSLLVFPQSFVRSLESRSACLLLIPLLSGIVMAGLGWLRDRQCKKLIRLDTFSYGCICAFGMALIRFRFAT